MAAQQLIPVFTGELTDQEIPFCNARDLHASLQVQTRFDDWMRRRIEEYGFVEGEDFSSNLRKSTGGRRSVDYRISLDMAKELAMIENNEIGRAVRRYFIQAEKTLREKLLAELRDKAEHVLPVRGVKLMRDGLNMKDTFRLQDQSHKVLRMMMAAKTKAERQNLHYHFRQINLVLGVPTIELDQIEQDECYGQPEKRG